MLSGPSGVGKTTVVADLLERHPEIWLSRSVTTRPRRAGEVDGVQYKFVSDAEFDELVAADELIEWAEYAGNRYGTPRRPVLDRLEQGVPVLLEIELDGARQVRASMRDALLVFLRPPSWEELERRLGRRGTEPAEAVARRLARAREELAAVDEFDEVLVNSDVRDTSDRLVALMGVAPSA